MALKSNSTCSYSRVESATVLGRTLSRAININRMHAVRYSSLHFSLVCDRGYRSIADARVAHNRSRPGSLQCRRWARNTKVHAPSPPVILLPVNAYMVASTVDHDHEFYGNCATGSLVQIVALGRVRRGWPGDFAEDGPCRRSSELSRGGDCRDE